MRIFIQALNYDTWSVIINEPYTPTIIVDGISITKPKKNWSKEDKRSIQLNAKVMNVLYCALDANKFN